MSNLTSIQDGYILRQSGPYSRSVHRLLEHLQAKGLERIPRFLGETPNGEEKLSFVQGEVIDDYPLSDEMLFSSCHEVGRMLRDLHDAAADFTRETADRWMFRYPGDLPCETICHNDIAPYNVTYLEGKPFGIIDFDAACPAPRVWDLAYAAYRFCSLSTSVYDPTIAAYRPYSPEQDDTIRQQALNELFNAYGMPRPADFPEIIAQRLEFLVDTMKKGALAGDEGFAASVARGDHELYLADATFIRKHF